MLLASSEEEEEESGDVCPDVFGGGGGLLFWVRRGHSNRGGGETHFRPSLSSGLLVVRFIHTNVFCRVKGTTGTQRLKPSVNNAG